jgi:hypothetical protein
MGDENRPKKLLKVASLLLVSFVLNSCGVSSAVMDNQNQNSTQVVLAGNNFKVVQQVKGSAEVQYFLFMGGVWKGALYARAYEDMMSKVDLSVGSRAIVNLVTEENIDGFFPIHYLRTITVSAQVIEFTGAPIHALSTSSDR